MLAEVSVVIPYAGRSDHLEAVLASLLESDYPRARLQVVVVRCPAAEARPAIWSRISHTFSCSWLILDRPGFAPASARNLGVAAADGSIIVGVDGDVVMSPGHIRAHVTEHVRSGCALSFGLRRFIRLSNAVPSSRVFSVLATSVDVAHSTSNRPGNIRDWRAEHISQLARHPAPYELALGCNLAYPRSLAREVGGWSSAFDCAFGYEDIEFAWRLSCAGGPIVCVPAAEALHLEDERDGGWKDKRERNFDLARRLIPGFRDHRRKPTVGSK